jgi:hypothetical protein
MCLKPKEPWPMPKETGEIGAKILAPGSVYKLAGDELFNQFSEADFADLYLEEGKPGYSPVILGFVSLFQYWRSTRIGRPPKPCGCAWIGSMRCTCPWRMPDLTLAC